MKSRFDYVVRDLFKISSKVNVNLFNNMILKEAETDDKESAIECAKQFIKELKGKCSGKIVILKNSLEYKELEF